MDNKMISLGNNLPMANFVKTNDILKDMCGIIESSQQAAYKAVNAALVQRNWLIGYRIAEEELQGEARSEYGLQIIKSLSKELTGLYGKGYDRSNLYHCLRFYKLFPEIVDTVCRQSGKLLSWSHYRALLQVEDENARAWYEKEAIEQTWSVRTLQRNISSQYYYRMLQTQKKDVVMQEMQDYYIDLVFYNYILKCFVLIDLKTEKITHQDVGQMDMYIRMYDELKRSEGDNPTIGIVLCSDTDEDIARYSVLHGNEQLFASKYKLYLPTEEELRAEIETQKMMYFLQQENNKKM